jgi:hypothetical protein
MITGMKDLIHFEDHTYEYRKFWMKAIKLMKIKDNVHDKDNEYAGACSIKCIIIIVSCNHKVFLLVI